MRASIDNAIVIAIVTVGLAVAGATISWALPTYQRSWGSYGTGPGQFTSNIDVAVDRHNNVYVCDRMTGRIQEFDSAGTYLGVLQTPGFQPLSIAANMSDDDLYVTDGSRVERFNALGTLVSSWETGADPISGIAVHPDGNVYVLAHQLHEVLVYSSTGTCQWCS